MGCGYSTEEGPKASKQPSTPLSTAGPTTREKSPTRDGLGPGARPSQQPLPNNNSPQYRLQVFGEAPPAYPGDPTTSSLRYNGLPTGVSAILDVIKAADNLRFRGHIGAWAALRERHQQVWLDTARTVPQVTAKAILLYATIQLLVGKAQRSKMTFYFTTFPNQATGELTNREAETLEALIAVLNAKNFRAASELITRSDALKNEGLENFINDSASFGAMASSQDKQIQLMALTREKMTKYWHGWDINDLDSKKLQTLFKRAQQESKEQPMLLNNTSFTYQTAVRGYRARLDAQLFYPLTCTFILGTRLEPNEVKTIQQCQLEDRKVWKGKTKGKNAGSVANLESEVRLFFIKAIVFNDSLNDQAEEAYRQVDNFLHGEPDDINDVSFFSETRFLLHLQAPEWYLKATTSHDPYIDNWEKLQTMPKYNVERIADENNVIWLPSSKLIRDVLGIDDDEEDDEDKHLPTDNTRAPRQDEIDLAKAIRPGTECGMKNR